MKKLLLGNEAIARGAYEAGATVSSAYPGTPSTEISEYLAMYDEIDAEWAPNEKVALEVAIGSAIGGARTVCAMKHVGLNVAADPLFTAAYTGINGGLVIFVADDPGMHSSQNEQDTRLLAKAAKIPVLEPSDSEECRAFTIEAFRISEQFDTPVIVRLTTRVAHSQSLVELGDREAFQRKPYRKDPGKYVMMPAMAQKRHFIVEKHLADMAVFAEDTFLNRLETADSDIGVITAGIAYQYAREAFGDVNYLKLGLIHPLPDNLLRSFAAKVRKLYVVEELDPFIEEHCAMLGIPVIGKSALPVIGEYSARLLRSSLFGDSWQKTHAITDSPPIRPPVMCAGCPHRGLFYILKKLKLTVSGDIGCYTLSALPPLETLDTCVCMGASVGVAHGMEKAMGHEAMRKTVAVIGDSTFIHSGITGLINVVYNGGTSTVIILDNSITGMTGHQQNPTTGLTLKGKKAKPVDLVKLCRAVGVERVRVVDPFDLEATEKAVREEIAAEEPSVIITRRPCALLKTATFKGQLNINRDKCRNCKACKRIGCPAIVDRGDHMEMNLALCVGCHLCRNLCKFDAMERVGD